MVASPGLLALDVRYGLVAPHILQAMGHGKGGRTTGVFAHLPTRISDQLMRQSSDFCLKTKSTIVEQFYYEFIKIVVIVLSGRPSE